MDALTAMNQRSLRRIRGGRRGDSLMEPDPGQMGSPVVMNDSVNHPDHYGGEHNPYETIKVIEAWLLDFNLGNTIKYISRAGKKKESMIDPLATIVEDLQKAAWYLNREIEILQKRLPNGS